ncbi:MAG: cytochrome c peroxidase [Bacteroidota bacterium]
MSILLVIMSMLLACEKEPTTPNENCSSCPDPALIQGEYAPTDYEFDIPDFMPRPIVPEDNPMTVEGVELGKMLFFDPILSRDSSQSCMSCHLPEKSFTDGLAVSTGIDGITGTRSAMALVNLAYHNRGFFWDGRVNSLEDQAILPIEDHTELADTWDNVEQKLRRHNAYPEKFRAAFGIEKKSEITRDLAVKAIAQFERTLISANSRYDQVIWGRDGFPTDSEQRGIALFFIEDNQNVSHPGCSHCHFNPLFTDNTFKNNGLDMVEELDQFEDLGRGQVNRNIYDNGKFKVPTLRNIALTAPYMHDGRFATLEEVLDQYATGGHGVINEDPNIRSFQLTDQDKEDLVAFLNMLTDTSFVNNPAFQSPFQ